MAWTGFELYFTFISVSSEIFMTSDLLGWRHLVMTRRGRMKTMKMGMKQTTKATMRRKAMQAAMTARGKRRTPAMAPQREQELRVPNLRGGSSNGMSSLTFQENFIYS